MLTILDAVVIVMLFFGAVLGFKQGVIKSAVSFIGTLLIIVIAFQLKNPISAWMYTNLPFFNFSGDLAGVTTFNILLYEGIAFLIIFAVLEVLLKLLVFASGLIEKILRITIIGGIISKFLGLIFGFVEAYLVIYVILFIAANLSFTSTLVEESTISQNVLNNTPVLKDAAKDELNAVTEIINLKDKYKNDKDGYNKASLEILIKYNIISAEKAEELVEKDKIDFDGALNLINKYKEMSAK